MRRSACPAACEGLEWWLCRVRFMICWTSTLVASKLTQAEHPLWYKLRYEAGNPLEVFNPAEMTLSALNFIPFFYFFEVENYVRLGPGLSPISPSVSVFESPPPYCGTGCLQPSSVLEPSGPLTWSQQVVVRSTTLKWKFKVYSWNARFCLGKNTFYCKTQCLAKESAF